MTGRGGGPKFWSRLLRSVPSVTSSPFSMQYLGWYNPFTKETVVNGEAVHRWMSNGAQPSDTVRSLLVKQGVLPPFQRPRDVAAQRRAELEASRAARRERQAAEGAAAHVGASTAAADIASDVGTGEDQAEQQEGGSAAVLAERSRDGQPRDVRAA